MEPQASIRGSIAQVEVPMLQVSYNLWDPSFKLVVPDTESQMLLKMLISFKRNKVFKETFLDVMQFPILCRNVCLETLFIPIINVFI